MPAPHIRNARSEDEQPLRRIDLETWSHLHAVSPPPGPDDPFFRDTCGPEAHLVAELDGAVVGYVRLGFPTPLASNTHVRQIRGLAVAGAARGHGVGRALVRAAVEEARQGASAGSPCGSSATTRPPGSSTSRRASSSRAYSPRSSTSTASTSTTS
jgi:ribosomal protein S18 acetylase RimI-like enzyme